MRQRLGRGLGAAVLGLALAASLAACTGQSGSGFRYSSSTSVGKVIVADKRKMAGNFTLPALTGNGTINLASYRGRVVLVNYWAQWCSPCIGEAPQLNLVYQQYQARGVTVVGVDTKDERQAAQSFVTNNHISYPNAYDSTGASARKIGRVPAVALPVSVLIDKDGKVAAVYTDRLSPMDLKPVLNTLLAES